MPFGLWEGGGAEEEEGRGTKNILARENRMKQVLRTSLVVRKMVILARSSNFQNCIKKTNKIPEYARDFKKEYLFVRGINKECFLLYEKYETDDTQLFSSCHSDRIKYFIKRFLKGQERGKLKDTSFIVFKKCDVYSIEDLYQEMKHDFQVKDHSLDFIDFFNLFSKFFEKINIRKYDDVDDDYVKPFEYISGPRVNIMEIDIDSDSDGFVSEDIDGLFSSSEDSDSVSDSD